MLLYNVKTCATYLPGTIITSNRACNMNSYPEMKRNPPIQFPCQLNSRKEMIRLSYWLRHNHFCFWNTMPPHDHIMTGQWFPHTLCEGITLVTRDSPHQGPLIWSLIDVFNVVHLNKLFNQHFSCQWYEEVMWCQWRASSYLKLLETVQGCS